MSAGHPKFALTVNGRKRHVSASPVTRLADALRDELGLTGTKIGCNAGDCGACTVLIDGEQTCACMVPVAQADGRRITTVEGLAANGSLSALQDAFHRHGAAQCGICTPGMLMAATDYLEHLNGSGAKREGVMDALGGVLCRCTGYQKIVEAVLDAANGAAHQPVDAATGAAVGARIAKVDGHDRVKGTAKYGADFAPDDALWLRAVRSPHAAARFTLGSFKEIQDANPGLARVLTWQDVPGNNGYGIYPHIKDQPVLAKDFVRYRGETVVALIGDRKTVERLRDEDLPIEWQPHEPLVWMADATAPDAPLLHESNPENVLTRGYVNKGDAHAALAAADVTAEGTWESGYVEHAYIEPEAGYAIRVSDPGGDRVEIHCCTQTPYMDRDEVAQVMGFDGDRIRIVPTACGGGFGGKLDCSVQPVLAVAAWVMDRPVRTNWTRPESMAASTKRHPSLMTARFGATKDGKLAGAVFAGDFNTGAYASWGPTVADRVPVHCSGPYLMPAIEAKTRAIYTNGPPSGAFRGFGVPQGALAHECLMDDLAEKLGVDPLEFRLANAIRKGDATATGQVLEDSAGLDQCLEALKPRWAEWRAAADEFNASSPALKRGVGIGCMWYGIGNTSIANPSTIRVGIQSDGVPVLFNGAQEIGQGSATIMVQIAADALGVPAAAFDFVMGDTDRTADAGKTSASRQTFVSGKATQLAGRDLRAQILRLSNAGDDARLSLEDGRIQVSDGETVRTVDLTEMTAVHENCLLLGEGTFNPPTTMLDDKGQGIPYACYGFAAQIAEVEVDTETGQVKATRMVAAHDVGRAVNPVQVEGQVQGGIAQGLGLALMEEYIPGRTENLHDYLIPTFGDMPEIETIIIEDPTAHGPWGAKGIGEPALVPTAPAILGGIRHATGVIIRQVPATPDRVRRALLDAAKRD